jgi:hypothetical protein
LVVPALVAVVLAVSLAGAALTPGTQSFEAKWADWLRAHHAGLVAQRFEEIYYSATAPAKGGQPKGLNKVPATVPGAALTTLPHTATTSNTVAAAAPSTVNGGFRFQDAKGGIYLEGRAGVALVPGAASFVIYKDGQVNIGTWGTDFSMGPGVESVLQNVVLLVDKGQLAPSATYTPSPCSGRGRYGP